MDLANTCQFIFLYYDLNDLGISKNISLFNLYFFNSNYKIDFMVKNQKV